MSYRSNVTNLRHTIALEKELDTRKDLMFKMSDKIISQEAEIRALKDSIEDKSTALLIEIDTGRQLKEKLEKIEKYLKPNPNTLDLESHIIIKELKEILIGRNVFMPC